MSGYHLEKIKPVPSTQVILVGIMLPFPVIFIYGCILNLFKSAFLLITVIVSMDDIKYSMVFYQCLEIYNKRVLQPSVRTVGLATPS